MDNLESLRRRAQGAFTEAEALGLGQHLQAALGVTEKHFRRMRSIALGTASMSDERQAAYLTERKVQALEGILSIARSTTADPQKSGYLRLSSADYAVRVAAGLLRLKEGDSHTLIAFPPPLEWASVEVVRAALVAAGNGAKLDYYFPSKRQIELAWERVLASPSPSNQQPGTLADDSAGVSRSELIRMFGWIEELQQYKDRVIRNFVHEARGLHLNHQYARCDQAPGVFLEALRKNVRVLELDWYPMFVNEKLVWLTEAGVTTMVRKEILLPERVGGSVDDSSDRLSPYAPDQSWASVEYPVENLAPLRILLKHRSSPIDWGLYLQDR